MRFLKKLKKISDEVVGMNRRNVELIYGNNDKSSYQLADDKYEAKCLLDQAGIACPKTYATIQEMGEIEQKWQEVSSYNTLVIKPAKGAGGKGILILKKVGERWYSAGKELNEEAIYTHIANILFGVYSYGDDDKAIIEEYIETHDFFHEIYPSGVPDIRVILLKGKPIQAMLRMPTKSSGGKANLHQGGLAIGIDMEVGALSEAYDGYRHLTKHPDTGVIVSGKLIPHWDKIKSISIEASQVFPLGYLGVDIVVDKRASLPFAM